VHPHRFGPGRGSGPRVGVLPASLTLAVAAAVILTAVAAPVHAQEPTGPASSAAVSVAPEEIPFPTTLAGVPLEVRTYSGPEWLAESGSGSADETAYVEQTQALLASLGRSLDDLSVKTALAQPTEGNQAVIAAVRIAGTEARSHIREMVRLLLGDIVDPALLMRPLGGRWILRVVDAATPGVYPRTVYIDDEIAWIIGADEEYVLELLDQLPSPPGPSSPGGDSSEAFIEQLPVTLAGERRAGLFESIEPLFLPTLSERIGPAFEAWLLDLYLDDGISPTDIVGADVWWGVQSPQEGLELEGYHVPGASPEMVDRLLKEVFLGDPTEPPPGLDLGAEPVPEEVGRVEEELGGHTVTTIDRGGGNRRHVFASDGTVWVVTDHVGQPELAAEAISALP
jgi:hypothetical protein